MSVHYRYYNRVIASDILLPLLPSESRQFDYALMATHSEFSEIQAFDEYYRMPDGSVWMAIAQSGTSYRIHFPRMADFGIDTLQSQIAAQIFPQVTPQTMAHLLVDQVMPRLLSTQGHTSIHASGVVVNGSAVLFLGHSGRGKSTLASEFHFNGYVGISDDAIFIEQANEHFFAVQSYPGFRLWSDSMGRYSSASLHYAPVAHYHTKQRIMLSESAPPDHPVPIQCVFLLTVPDESTDIRIDRLTHQQAFWTLTQHSFRLMPSDSQQLEREFFLFGTFAKHIPCFALTHPRSFKYLPAVLDRILRHLDAVGS